MSDRDADASGEDRLIAAHFRSIATTPGALSLEDDAAFLTQPDGCDLVVTKDAIVAGIHFLPDDPPDLIARKALRVNLSDLAAKGAQPLAFLLALALPERADEAWLSAFSRGLGEDARAYGCALLGGDTVRSPGPVMASVTAMGSVPRGTMVRRRGARPGDGIYVTGTIGDGALGLFVHAERPRAAAWRLSAEQRQYLASRYLLPQPRNALAELVRTHASAAMDVSDGLVGDLRKLCRVSAVAAEVDVGCVPLSDAGVAAIAADADALAIALTGGDDYEIVCTVPQERGSAFVAAAATLDVPIAKIGVVTAGRGARFTRAGTTMEFKRGAFSHF